MFNCLKHCFYHKQFWKLRCGSSKYFIQFNISYVALKSFIFHLYVIRTSIVCTRMSLVCYSYVNHIFLYAIRMSLLCARILFVYTCMPFVCHLYIFVYIRMLSVSHSYVLICNGMSLVCTRMWSVCHSCVLLCHRYVTRMYSHVIRMSLVSTRMSSVCHLYVALPWTVFFDVCRFLEKWAWITISIHFWFRDTCIKQDEFWYFFYFHTFFWKLYQ